MLVRSTWVAWVASFGKKAINLTIQFNLAFSSFQNMTKIWTFNQGIRRQKFWRFLKNIWTFFLDLFLSCLPTHCVDWRTRTAILEITNFCHLVIAVAESSKCFCSVHCLEFKLLKTVYKNLMLQGGMWPICSGIDKPAVIYWLEKSDAEKRDVLHLSASVPSWSVAFLYANLGPEYTHFWRIFQDFLYTSVRILWRRTIAGLLDFDGRMRLRSRKLFHDDDVLFSLQWY